MVLESSRLGDMPKKSQISVVIPCYNQARFLGEAIESVLRQTVRDFEVIVVDDGSSDNTREVAARYREVRYNRQDNGGVSAARNTGLSESKGDYLIFLDADDRLLPHALETGLNNLQSHPHCAFVWGHSQHIAEDGTPVASRPKPRIERHHYRELLRTNYIRTPGEVMYRRAVFEAVGNFDTSLQGPEDYDLNLRITRSFPVFCHGQVINEYRVHNASATANSGPMLRMTLAALRQQRAFVKGNREFEEAYEFGLKSWREFLGTRLANEVLIKIRSSDRRDEALRGLWILLNYYPLGFLRHVSGRLRQTLSTAKS